MKRKVLLCLLFAYGISIPAIAQMNVGDNGKLSTLAFGDYYWIPFNHNSELEGNNGFWFRRIYFTYDHQISKSFTGRVRLEMNSEGDFVSSSKLEPTVKDAYLKWANDNHSITAGISSTPTFGLTEDIWGYRSIEKSPQDLFDFGSSRDFGLSFKGKIGSAERLKYHFMVGNGNSNGSELNKGKKFMFALSYNLTENLVVEGYADWNDKEGDTDSYTIQGLLGYQSDTFNLGGLYSYQIRENETASGDLNLDLVSLFTNIHISDQTKVFARADHLFDAHPSGPDNDYIPFSDQAESTFLTTGVDISLDDNVHLMPNVEAIIYGENDLEIRPDTDLIARLTLLFIF